MFSLRSRVLVALIALPTLIFIGVGAYAVWENGSLGWVWWMMTGFALVTGAIAIFWKTTPPSGRAEHRLNDSQHWTPRDKEAAQIVRDRQLQVDKFTAEQLTDPHFYVQEVQALALDLAKHYHPQAADPLKKLTVPEVLAAVRLAVDDMERWMLESVPGSQFLTIRHWQLLQSAPMWMQRLSETAWAASMLLNPLNIARYFASKWSWGSVTERVQSEILAVVYLRFIRQAGTYLIEMNSGRLRGGADAYRAAFQAADVKEVAATTGAPVEAPPITIALLGQVSSGKSSLINQLTGMAQASVHALPETKEVRQYQWTMGDPPVTLALLDTPGYGESGATRQQLQQIGQALEACNAALLVMDAHSPAREPDRKLLEQLQGLYREQPQLKPPPVVGVLTHIDLLSPPLEWSPPYNWRQPDSAKARGIREAVAYAGELFGSSLVKIVPVCSDTQPGRAWGVIEELIPTLVEILDEARSGALLRMFESQLERGRWKSLLKQVGRSGREWFRAWMDDRLAR